VLAEAVRRWVRVAGSRRLPARVYGGA